MLELLLIAIAHPALGESDEFGRQVCGVGDVNGDGVGDLVVSDKDFEGYGALWTVSGRDGSRLVTALGDERHVGLGGSFFALGEEICACVTTPNGPALLLLDRKTLRPVRESEPVTRAQAFHAAVAAGGDFDQDGVVDAVLCLGPNDLKHAFLEIVSGKSGKRLRTIELGLEGGERPGRFGTVGDLDGDGVPDLGAVAGEVLCFSGRTGERLRAFPASDGSTHLGTGHLAIGDVDGDGVGDFGLAQDHFVSGEVLLFSGRSGKFIRTHTEGLLGDRFGACIADVGDLDHDGRSDYAIGAARKFESFVGGLVYVYSGADGRQLFVLDEPSVSGRPISPRSAPRTRAGARSPAR